MKALFLGAGASIHAGYPPARRLLEELTVFGRSPGTDLMTRTQWADFEEFRDSAQGALAFILRSSNPEIVLSLPDLYAEARAEGEEENRKRFYTALKAGDDDVARRVHEELGTLFGEEGLARARRALRGFVNCLDHFLLIKHAQGADSQNRSLRRPMRELLGDLSEGDVVITTNWDTVVERTLLEEGRWSPADGYGFSVSLVDKYGPGNRWPEWVPTSSQIRVLKIHGSHGWRRHEVTGALYLRHSTFLQHMPFVRNGEHLWVRDTSEPERVGPPGPAALVYPSYLKQIEGEAMQEVWFRASEAMRCASEIRIVGSSLPAADVAVRMLLNPLRWRLGEGSISVTVQDPDPGVRRRWRQFLGDGVYEDPEPLA